MNDYWNDPRDDQPDPPACPNDKPPCLGHGEYLYAGNNCYVFSCDTCGYQWTVPFPPEEQPQPEEQPLEDDLPQDKPCPHGIIGPCDACDRLSDLNYDANRENRR